MWPDAPPAIANSWHIEGPERKRVITRRALLAAGGVAAAGVRCLEFGRNTHTSEELAA